MKRSVRIAASLLPVFFLAGSAARVHAQSSSTVKNGTWYGTAKVRDIDVPITIRLTGTGSQRQVAFLNGPASHPDISPASSVKLDGNHLVASFDYFARTLDATVEGDSLTGTYGAAQPGKRPVLPTNFSARCVAELDGTDW